MTREGFGAEEWSPPKQRRYVEQEDEMASTVDCLIGRRTDTNQYKSQHIVQLQEWEQAEEYREKGLGGPPILAVGW